MKGSTDPSMIDDVILIEELDLKSPPTKNDKSSLQNREKNTGSALFPNGHQEEMPSGQKTLGHFPADTLQQGLETIPQVVAVDDGSRHDISGCKYMYAWHVCACAIRKKKHVNKRVYIYMCVYCVCMEEGDLRWEIRGCRLPKKTKELPLETQ